MRAAVVERAKTHRARMRKDIDVTVQEMFGAQHRARLADCFDLGMRRRIIRLANTVDPLSDDDPVAHNYTGERPPALLDVAGSEINCVGDEVDDHARPEDEMDEA